MVHTDKYITPQQAAEKWRISRRTVRQYLDSGRIDGVVNVNGRTLIPSAAEKPSDRRRRQSRSEMSDPPANPFVLTTSPFKPGEAEKLITETADEAKRTIGLAELAYLRGDADTACRLCRSLSASDNMETRLGALLIDLLAALFKESGTTPVNNFRDLQTIAKIAAEHPKYKKTGELFGLYLNITVHNRGDIVFPESCRAGRDSGAVCRIPLSARRASRKMHAQGGTRNLQTNTRLVDGLFQKLDKHT